MKRLVPLLVLIAPVFLTGCGNGDTAEMKTDPATVANPGGDPNKLPPQAQGVGAKQQAAGEAASHNMDEMARQMNAAKAKSGGQ